MFEKYSERVGSQICVVNFLIGQLDGSVQVLALLNATSLPIPFKAVTLRSIRACCMSKILSIISGKELGMRYLYTALLTSKTLGKEHLVYKM